MSPLIAVQILFSSSFVISCFLLSYQLDNLLFLIWFRCSAFLGAGLTDTSITCPLFTFNTFTTSSLCNIWDYTNTNIFSRFTSNRGSWGVFTNTFCHTDYLYAEILSLCQKLQVQENTVLLRLLVLFLWYLVWYTNT